MVVAVADVAVTVSNAQDAMRWWTEKVGFATHTIDGLSGHAVMVAPPGDRFLLHLCEGFEPVSPGNTGIAFVTDDIDGLVGRMTKAGVAFPEPLQRSDGGALAKFSDPDGNIFWLIEVPATFIRAEMARRAGGRSAPRSRRTPSRRPKRPRARAR